MLYRERPELTTVRANAASSGDRDKLHAMVWSVLLSQQDEILSAIVTTTTRKGKITIGDTMGERREEYSVLTGSSELELGKVCKEKTSLAVLVNEEEVLVKT